MPLRIVQNHIRIGDPHVTSDDVDRLSILNAVVEPLVRRAEYGLFAPCLAVNWTLSDDARSWRFDLRPEVSFHDGKPFVAEDAVTTLERIREGSVGGELGTGGVFQSYLSGSTFEATDNHTLKLTTPEPFADLLDLLVDIPILSEDAIQALPETMTGTGPYRLSGQTQEQIILSSFDPHWNDVDRQGTIEWSASPDARTRVEMLLEGAVDLAGSLPPAAQTWIRNDPHIQIIQSPTSVCATFMFNLFNGPCRNREVRQALNYALDKHNIINKILGGGAEPITGPITSRHFGFDPEVPGYLYNPDLARRLLRHVGFEKGLQIDLDVPTTLPDEAVELAKYMKSACAEIGIETQIHVYDHRPAYAEMVRNKAIHDAACFDSSPSSTFRILWEKFHSGRQGPWWMGYKNPEIDRLIDRARATSEIGKRQQIYRLAHSILKEDAPWIFLYNPVRYVGARSGTKGWSLSPIGRFQFS